MINKNDLIDYFSLGIKHKNDLKVRQKYYEKMSRYNDSTFYECIYNSICNLCNSSLYIFSTFDSINMTASS